MISSLSYTGTTYQFSLFDITAEAEPSSDEMENAAQAAAAAAVAPYRCLDPNCDGFTCVCHPDGVRMLFCDEKTCVHNGGTRLEELP